MSLDLVGLALAKKYTDKKFGEGSGTNINIDTTLTVEGAAADAKVVGDSISSLSDGAVKKNGNNFTEEQKTQFRSEIGAGTSNFDEASLFEVSPFAPATDKPYVNFVEKYQLRQNNWVDLSFVGNPKYYTDLATAISDINTGVRTNGTDTEEGALCCTFYDGKITVLRMLDDHTLQAPLTFSGDCIFDLNGKTITRTLTEENWTYEMTINFASKYIVLYGQKEGSAVTVDATGRSKYPLEEYVIRRDTYQTLDENGKWSVTEESYCWILGGCYSLTINQAEYLIQNYVIFCMLPSTYDAAETVERVEPTRFFLNNADVLLTTKVAAGQRTGALAGVAIGYNYTSTSPCYKDSLLFEMNNCNVRFHALNGGDSNQAYYAVGIFSSSGIINGCTINGGRCGVSLDAPDRTDISFSGKENEIYIKNSRLFGFDHGGFTSWAGAPTVYFADTILGNDTSTTSGTFTSLVGGAAYFGAANPAFVDNCQFVNGNCVLKPYDSKATVYMSNSTTVNDYIRVDANATLYLGEGMENTTTSTNGTIISTEHNYCHELERTSEETLSNQRLREANTASQIKNDGVIIRSATLGSVKKFKIMVDDLGTLTAIEVT